MPPKFLSGVCKGNYKSNIVNQRCKRRCRPLFTEVTIWNYAETSRVYSTMLQSSMTLVVETAKPYMFFFDKAKE